MDSLKMYFLLEEMGIFHSYVSLPEGRWGMLIFHGVACKGLKVDVVSERKF